MNITSKFLVCSLSLVCAALSYGDDQKERSLYQELRSIDVRYNRVLDSVKDEASAGQAAPQLEQLQAEAERINRTISGLPQDNSTPKQRELELALLVYDEYGILSAYLLDRNLRRIKALGIHSQSFDKAVGKLFEHWPQLSEEPFDLIKHLEISAQWRERERENRARE